MNAIEVNNLTKIYKLYSSPKDRLKEILTRKKHHHDFYALNDVSFTIEKGQTVGIIGQNGSGKSTLLQIICGVLQPTCGSVRANGRIAALLELGAGFNPEFTGRENVYMNGALMGFSREDMDRRFPEIEAFAEIGEFIDQPVKTYSSGMYVRLAFSSAVNIDPEILVVDEALSVGDMYFQHRCISRMESFRAEGKTIVLVTHDINLVKSFCDKAVLMDHGRVFDSGDPEYITEQYMMLSKRKQTEHAERVFRVNRKYPLDASGTKIQFGSEAGEILKVSILNKELKETAAVLSGDTVVLAIHARFDPRVRMPKVGFMLRDQRGYNVYGTDTNRLGLQLKLDENQQVTVFFSFSPVLMSGTYSFVVRLEEFWTPKVNMLLDKQAGVGAFQVIENKTKFVGVVDLGAQAFQDLDYASRKSP